MNEKELQDQERKGYEGSVYPGLGISFKRACEINNLVYKACYKVSLNDEKERSIVFVWNIINKDLKTNYEIAAACMMIGRAIENPKVLLAFLNKGEGLIKSN